MKNFTKLSSDFWINYENSELINSGTDAQLMALYLVGNSHHNMLGVYYLPMSYIANDVKLSLEQVKITLQKLCKVNYCKYDEKTQYIWVCNMASEQMGENIDVKDKRIKSLQSIWKSLPLCLVFLQEVYQKYCAVFYLEERFFIKPNSDVGKGGRESECNSQPIFLQTAPLEVPAMSLCTYSEGGGDTLQSSFEAPSQEALSPFQAPLKPLAPTQSCTKKEQSAAQKPLRSPFEGGDKLLASPSGAPSKEVPSPLQAPSKPLRSNIEVEYRRKNIEERRKKGEEEGERDKEGEENQNHVAPARLGGGENSPCEIFLQQEEKTLPQVAEKNQLLAADENRSPAAEENLAQQVADDLSQSFVTHFMEDGSLQQAEKNLPQQHSEERLPQCTGKNLSPRIEDNSPQHTEEQPPRCAEEPVAQCAEENPVHSAEENSPYTAEENSAPHPADEHLPQFAGENSCCPVPAKPPNTSPPPAPAKISAPRKLHPTKYAVSEERITQVFEHWTAVMQHPRSNLDDKRRSLIRKALQLGYSVDQLCQAIVGCSYTPHNMGQNDRGQRFDGLHIILRDADQIDRFIHNYRNPPKPFTKTQQLTQNNVQVMRDWLQRKLREPDDDGGDDDGRDDGGRRSSASEGGGWGRCHSHSDDDYGGNSGNYGASRGSGSSDVESDNDGGNDRGCAAYCSDDDDTASTSGGEAC